MSSIALLLSAAASALPPSEAEFLLRAMDKKIAAAKTLRVEFEIKLRSESVARGSLVLADGNRFRNEFAVGTGAPPTVLVSDGVQVRGSAAGRPIAVPVPAYHNEVLKSWLGRGGSLTSMSAAARLVDKGTTKRPESSDGLRVSKARLMPDEEVGGVKARVVEYTLSWQALPYGFRVAKARVWIDPRTGLPVRRTMPFGGNSGGETFTTTQTRFEIDTKIDEKLFEHPK